MAISGLYGQADGEKPFGVNETGKNGTHGRQKVDVEDNCCKMWKWGCRLEGRVTDTGGGPVKRPGRKEKECT